MSFREDFSKQAARLGRNTSAFVKESRLRTVNSGLEADMKTLYRTAGEAAYRLWREGELKAEQLEPYFTELREKELQVQENSELISQLQTKSHEGTGAPAGPEGDPRPPEPRPAPEGGPRPPEPRPEPEGGPRPPEPRPAPEGGPRPPEPAPGPEGGPRPPEPRPAPEGGPRPPEPRPEPEGGPRSPEPRPEPEGGPRPPEPAPGPRPEDGPERVGEWSALERIYCQNCGNECPITANYCRKCGTKLH